MFFPAPGDTPSRDFWFRGNWNYLNGFSFKVEKYVWEINKNGGWGVKNRSYLPQNIFADKELEALD